MLTEQQIHAAVHEIQHAILETLEDYNRTKIKQEPEFTVKLTTKIEDRLKNINLAGVRWNAKILTDRGAKAEEKIIGADFMGVLEIDLPDYKVKKGFLVQAKMSGNINSPDLMEQCQKMLKHSNESFVFIYDKDGISVIKASEILNSESKFSQLPRMSAEEFYYEHFKCFIGDHAIKSANGENLYELMEKYEARRLLHLVVFGTEK